MQLNHYNNNFKQQTFPITIVCQNVTNAPNIGSLFRTSDAFGIKELVFTGTEIPLGRKMTKTSRATEKVVNYQVVEDAFGFISNLKNEGHQIISLEITDNSVALHKFSFNLKAPIVLVIGDENFGVSDQILSISDAIIHIDMFGQNSSMNVVQATSIALYEMTKQIMAK